MQYELVESLAEASSSRLYDVDVRMNDSGVLDGIALRVPFYFVGHKQYARMAWARA